MDPPPLTTATTATTVTHVGAYPDSVESSPRSRNTDSWDEPLPQVPGAKLRLMCSYGGHIFPRPHDKSLCYLGGDTRIIVADRHSSLADLSLRLSRSVLDGQSFTLKYQLPNEDLDSLISVTTDEDLENMIEEYDRTSAANSHKPSRLRLFLFPTKVETASSIGTMIEDSKSENWFVEALNGAGYLPRGVSADAASVNCLLGLDDVARVDREGDLQSGDSLGNINKQVKGNNINQEFHSMPDSPMLETTSSFGSTSSSPSMANLPPIRVHVEDQKVGLEESFAQMSVSAAPPPLPTSIVATVAMSSNNAFFNENPNRVVSDDERSEQGVPTGYRKPLQQPSPQMQQKTGDLSSPDENSRAKPLIYQDQVQVAQRENWVPPSNPVVDPKRDVVSDPNYRIQMQQVQDSSGYLMPSSQMDQQQQFQQQQQFTHYIHHTTGPVPISSYYPMHPQQHQHQIDQHYPPMYFVPMRQTQPYNLSMQSNLSDSSSIPSSRPPLPPNPTILTTGASYKEPVSSVYPRGAPTPVKPELGSSVYRTATTATPPQLVQMPSADQHYGNYSHQMHQPSNYTYEFTDPAHSQIYYTQPIAAALPPQYQTISSAAGIQSSSSEVSAQFPTESTKQQQMRTSQPI